eukprot:5413573-Pleurochrysis_carterae.AAC.1
MRKHNRLADFAAQLVRAAHRVGVPWFVENLADCGEAGSAAWWSAFTSHAPLSLYPPVRAALEETGAQRVTFAQCALGARVR